MARKVKVTVHYAKPSRPPLPAQEGDPGDVQKRGSHSGNVLAVKLPVKSVGWKRRAWRSLARGWARTSAVVAAPFFCLLSCVAAG